MMLLLTNTVPPGATRLSNFARAARFMATTSLGRSTRGAPMRSSLMITVQLAVPPRISGP